MVSANGYNEKRKGFKMKRIMLFSAINLIVIASFVLSRPYAASENLSYAYSLNSSNVHFLNESAESVSALCSCSVPHSSWWGWYPKKEQSGNTIHTPLRP